MVVLENDAFLTSLTLMYQKARLHGSVRVTLKRYDGRTKPVPRVEATANKEEPEYSCIFRATLASKKISTIVTANALSEFQAAFSSTIRSNMDGLKKQKKSKGKRKSKATATQ
ncbi:signal recognition particle 14 kDa protein-like [Daphnia pulex]|uniref:signal recognition particle 14 kDa protein-like n=1 Tax=Daphnia pulex TaxID=6669 RepID=UPI001EDF1344|nr:signal recognition particle 14 kDa protein-like [Daphnia pulex]